MEMTFEQKRDAAIEFLNKFSQMFDVNFTNEQRAFCIGYLVSMLDAAEQSVQPTCATSWRKRVASKSKVHVGRTRG